MFLHTITSGIIREFLHIRSSCSVCWIQYSFGAFLHFTLFFTESSSYILPILDAWILQESDIQKCKGILVKRGHDFLDKVKTLRKKISKLANPFITDGSVSGFKLIIYMYSYYLCQWCNDPSGEIAKHI